MSRRPPPARSVFEVPPRVLTLARVLLDAEALDGSHVWVLGILNAGEGEWRLEEGAQRIRLDVGPELEPALTEPLWVNEGRRCAVSGALIRRRGEEPFLVVERVVTARSLGIRLDAN